MNSSTTGTDLPDARPPSPLELAWAAHVTGDTGDGDTGGGTGSDDDTGVRLFDRLVSRHRERQRRYHRIQHVEAVIGHVTDLAAHESVRDLGAVVAAAFWHDAIHEPQHPNNERASARLATRDLTELGWSSQRCQAVASMIEATAGHADPADIDAAVLLDADLAILAADAADYDRYALAVRDEYSHFDDSEWRAGRTTVLNGFIQRESIFATQTGRDRWETAARRNIEAELEKLTR